jgi:salicylate hydroxylase
VLYRALVPIEQVPDIVDKKDVHLWLQAHGHVVHYPVRDGTALNIVASVTERWSAEMTWGEPTSADSVHRIFASVAEPLKAVLQTPEKWLRWAGADRPPVDLWGKGRTTLIGDAAHPTLPYLASGAVMALEDAVVLLRHMAEQDELQAAFRAYEKERQPRTRRIVESSWKLARVYHATGVMALGRDMFLRMQGASGGHERMAWLYGWQP